MIDPRIRDEDDPYLDKVRRRDAVIEAQGIKARINSGNATVDDLFLNKTTEPLKVNLMR